MWYLRSWLWEPAQTRSVLQRRQVFPLPKEPYHRYCVNTPIYKVEGFFVGRYDSVRTFQFSIQCCILKSTASIEYWTASSFNNKLKYLTYLYIFLRCNFVAFFVKWRCSFGSLIIMAVVLWFLSSRHYIGFTRFSFL